MRALRRAAIIGAGQQLGMVYDRFNRADGDIGTADSGETYEGGYSPIGWSIVSGKAKRASATIAIAGYSAAAIPISIETGDYTVDADVTIPVSGENSGIFGRGWNGVDCALAIAVRIYYNYVYLVTMGSDRKVDTTISSQSHSLTVGSRHNFKLVLSGTTATILIDDVQVLTDSISAWAGNSYLNVGMMSSYATAAPTSLFDNFRAF